MMSCRVVTATLFLSSDPDIETPSDQIFTTGGFIGDAPASFFAPLHPTYIFHHIDINNLESFRYN